MVIPALIWGGVKLATIFGSVAYTGNALTKDNNNKGLLEKAWDYMTGSDEPSVQPVATGITIGRQATANATQFNQNATVEGGAGATQPTGVLDTVTGKVEEIIPEETDGYGFFDYIKMAWDQFQKDDYMGAIGSVFNAFTHGEEGSDGRNWLNPKTMGLAAAVMGGGFALKNLFTPGKGLNDGWGAKLAIAGVAASGITMLAQKFLLDDDKPSAKASTDAPAVQRDPLAELAGPA